MFCFFWDNYLAYFTKTLYNYFDNNNRKVWIWRQKEKKPTVRDFKTYKLIYDENGELKTDLELLWSLREWRLYITKKEHLPATYIFYNETLVAFATYFPQTEEEFLRAFGAGKRKWQKYGATIVRIIKDHLISKQYGEDITIPF